MIADPEASKPEGWEDDEPTEVADPSASMPEDWDEDDDGVWEAPLVANPKCSVGCGEWKAPQIANPGMYIYIYVFVIMNICFIHIFKL